MARLQKTAPLAAFAALISALALASPASAATYAVDSSADEPDAIIDGTCADDSGKCTLRAALDEANRGESDDRIVVPKGLFELGGNEGDDENYDGDLDVYKETGTLVIEGAGAQDTVIDANGRDRVLDVHGATLQLSGVTLRGGRGIAANDEYLAKIDLAEETLELSGRGTIGLPPTPELRSFGPGEIVTASGAGLRASSADVTLVDTVVSHNNAGDAGAAGGILNYSGSLTLDRTRVHRNTANLAGGGIVNIGELTVNESTVSDNVGTLLGGGILNVGPLAIDSSTVSGNFSVGHGGGLFDLGVAGEEPTLGRGAAGALLDAGDSWIVNSTFSDNAVRFGQGGGVFHASLGGGGECEYPEGTGTGTNTSTDPCEEDPAIGATLSIDSTTLADNSVVNADNTYVPLGIPSYGRGASVFAYGPVSLRGSIISGGTDRGRADDCATAGGQGLIETLGGNVETGNTCQLDPEFDQVRTDLLLDALRDNGGPTETRALRAGSPAIDAAASGGCPETDQRGGDRPPEAGSAGEACDAGAYEAGSLADLSVETLTAAPDPAVAGVPLTYGVTVRNNGPDAANGVKLALPVPEGASLVSVTPSSCTDEVACDLGTLANGQTVHVRVVVKPVAAGTLTATAAVNAAGLADLDRGNDTAQVSTTVDPAPVVQQQQQTPPDQQLPDTRQPQQRDTKATVKLTVPKSVTLKQFLGGITVSAACGEECLRRFREHVGINTGGTRIAGYNLTVSRGSLGFASRTNKVKLRPCTEAGKKKKQCLSNLTKAAKKATPFKVKVVVTAIDRAGNRTAAKAFLTVKK